MVEREDKFRYFLMHDRFRRLAEGTSISYVDYLNNVSNHLGIEINASRITSEDSIQNIIHQLENTDMPDGSRRNCQSALRAYLEFMEQSQEDNIVYPDDVPTFIEGAVNTVYVNKYERDAKARRACINHHKAICKVCGIDFGKRYGAIGKAFIHVHHIVPVASNRGQQYQVDPIADLVPVCPNCHAMLHKKSPPFTVGELKRIMNATACEEDGGKP